MTHNRPKLNRWTLVPTGIACIVVAVVLMATAAFATHAAVTVTRTCTTLTWTVTNDYTAHLDGLFETSIGYGRAFHLDPGQSTGGSADTTGHTEAVTFSVSGTFTGGAAPVWTYNPASKTVDTPAGCTPPPTYTPPPSTAPPLPSTLPATTTPTVVPPVEITAPAPAPPVSDAVTDAPPPTALPEGGGVHPTSPPKVTQLPHTGAGDVLTNIAIGLIVGGSLILIGVAIDSKRRAR